MSTTPLDLLFRVGEPRTPTRLRSSVGILGTPNGTTALLAITRVIVYGAR